MEKTGREIFIEMIKDKSKRIIKSGVIMLVVFGLMSVLFTVVAEHRLGAGIFLGIVFILPSIGVIIYGNIIRDYKKTREYKKNPRILEMLDELYANPIEIDENFLLMVSKEHIGNLYGVCRRDEVVKCYRKNKNYRVSETTGFILESRDGQKILLQTIDDTDNEQRKLLNLLTEICPNLVVH